MKALLPKMKAVLLTTLALTGLPAHAQTDSDAARQVKALQERVSALERRLEAAESVAPTVVPAVATEQAQELARIGVKTEALEDSRDASGFKGLKLSGYVDPTFIYNYDLRRAGFQFLVPVGAVGYGYSASYFGSASLDVLKEMDGGARWHLTLMPARSSSDVFGNLGDIVHEASVSVPLGNLQTRLIAGQLPDWSGYEYLPATQNKLITHNMLFDYTLPIAYTGGGLEIIRGKWDVKAIVANMNGSHRKDGEYVPVIAYRVDYSGGEFWGAGLAGLNGKTINWRDPANLPDSRVDLLEVDGYYIRGDVTLQAQLGAGRQAAAAIVPDPANDPLREAQWLGVSALGAYKFTPRVEGVLRADFIYDQKNGGGLLTYSAVDDHNGLGPAPGGDPLRGANRYAVSAGGSFAFTTNVVFKAEYRLDGADLRVFRVVSDGGLSRTNHLFGTSVVVSF